MGNEMEVILGGRTWVYVANITNNGSNSGTHVYTIVPGAGNEMEVLYGALFNDDTSTRTGFVRVRDPSATFELGRLAASLAITAGGFLPFPTIDELAVSSSAAASRWIVAGTMEIDAQLLSIAVSQDSAFSIVCRIRGDLPTVTLTSPTDAVEVVNVNRVF